MAALFCSVSVGADFRSWFPLCVGMSSFAIAVWTAGRSSRGATDSTRPSSRRESRHRRRCSAPTRRRQFGAARPARPSNATPPAVRRDIADPCRRTTVRGLVRHSDGMSESVPAAGASYWTLLAAGRPGRTDQCAELHRRDRPTGRTRAASGQEPLGSCLLGQAQRGRRLEACPVDPGQHPAYVRVQHDVPPTEREAGDRCGRVRTDSREREQGRVLLRHLAAVLVGDHGGRRVQPEGPARIARGGPRHGWPPRRTPPPARAEWASDRPRSATAPARAPPASAAA